MEILHSEPDFAVCVKPVGLDSEAGVPAALSQQLGGDFFPVHRLDLNVGGMMVYARNSRAAAQFSRLIQEGSLKKEYVAMVHGNIPEGGILEDLLWKDSKKNKVFVVDRERKGVKKAKLEYKRLWNGDESLVRILLHTGRSHQIRVQFASRGYPLVGDHKYGAKDEKTAPMLFSCCLSFPWKGKTMRFEKLPDWAPDYSEVQLETPDLILKKAQFSDWKDIYRNLWCHAESAKYMLWDVTTTDEAAQARMNRTIEFEKRNKYALFVYEKATGQAIGFCGMQELEPGIYEETGLALGPEYTRKGYGKQAASTMIAEAFRLGATEFHACARSQNAASLQLQASLGFRYAREEEKIDPRNGESYTMIHNVLWPKDCKF